MSHTSHAPEVIPPSAFAPHLPIRYPTNAVIGILDTRDELEHAVQALIDAGFWESEIEVAVGEAVAEAVHATTGRTGITGLVLKVAQWLGVQDEEMEYKAHYEHALRDGHFVIVVQTPTGDRKTRAAEILRERHAYSLNFHGRYVIEELSPAR